MNGVHTLQILKFCMNFFSKEKEFKLELFIEDIFKLLKKLVS